MRVSVFALLLLATAVCAVDPVSLDERFQFQQNGVSSTCYRIAFERYPLDANANTWGTLNTFESVADQYLAWGVRFGVEPLCARFPNPNPSSPICAQTVGAGLKIFDSSNPSVNDLDLGTPNNQCGGPGVSEDPELALEHTCNVQLHNILIIQNRTANVPDDSIDGGRIVVTFNRDVTVRGIGIIDIEESEAVKGADVLWFNGADQKIGGYNITGPLGDNVYRLFKIPSPPVVRKVRIDFPGSGALTDLVFCDNEQDILCGLIDDLYSCCENGDYCLHQEARNPTGKTVCLDPNEFISSSSPDC